MPDIRPLNPELAKKAETELHEVPSRIDEDLKALRTWLAKQPHLRTRTDDQFLVMFLRGAKFSLERAKEKIDMYYTIRTLVFELFDNRDPTGELTLKILRMGVAIPLPLTDGPDGPRIILIRPGVYDANAFKIHDVMKVNTMISDVLMKDDDNVIVAGQVGILDLANVTMAHFLQFNPTFVKKMTMMSQEGSPLRQKGFHYLNTPNGFETLFNMFKGFMSEKNQKRLYVHGSDMESLFKHVPKRLLPTEYGGEAGPLQNIINDWEKKILEHREYFAEDAKFTVDEKKRVGPSKTAENLFGVEGSFRKLDVD